MGALVENIDILYRGGTDWRKYCDTFVASDQEQAGFQMAGYAGPPKPSAASMARGISIIILDLVILYYILRCLYRCFF